MDKFSKYPHFYSSKTSGLLVFVEYLRSLGETVENSSQLFDGKLVFRFLRKVINNTKEKDEESLNSSQPSNKINLFKEVMSVLESYERNIINNDKLSERIQINLVEICYNENSIQLTKLLIRIFNLAVQVPNKDYFIEAAMRLHHNYQETLAQFLKNNEIIDHFESPEPFSRESLELDQKRTSQIELIDKIYEFQQQNEKLQYQISQLHQQKKGLNESITMLQKNIDNLRIQNDQYRLLVMDYEEIVENIRNKNEGERFGEKKKENNEQICKILKEYNENKEIMKVEKEGIQKKFQIKIKELNQIIKNQKQQIKTLNQTIELQQSQIQELTYKYTTTFSEGQCKSQTIRKLQQKNEALEEQAAAFQFELNFKNSQIQELKQIIFNASTTLNRDEDNQMRKPMMLGDFSQPPVSPRSMLKLDMEQLKALRIQVKQQNSEINSLKNMKKMNKQLEYEKKKLMKILQEYETSRGEESEILNGCLYELRIKYSMLKNAKNEDETNCS